ncbi:hypothetical protein CA54_43580 [Symmachiella macrocystis]|uniref:Knr4/Smi1-like domain-containing protein n=1 Tax=Symmachiella macrocystis TaxID=2527985 RepID=A0A5C6BAW4_9PLAN|nr:hypothetical protein [Symmachiella macrocystis]TWU09118.1 hypothetical protein CA54_43580 [Symmachiella macrocystis]
MNWQEKLETTRRFCEHDESLDIYFELADGAPEEFLATLRDRFPFVDDDYLTFLKISDGASFDMCTLFGSGCSGYRGVIAEIESLGEDLEDIPEWENVAVENQLIPIGKTAGGDGLLMMPDRRIVIIDYIHEVPGEGRTLAYAFSQLLDDVFMGPNFGTLLYPDKWAADDENGWTRYLHKQGWWPEGTGN